MPLRVGWEDEYALAYRTSAIAASDSETAGLFETGDFGIPGADKCGFLIDEHPNINAGIEVVTTDKTTGLSQKQTGASAVGIELMIARKLPVLSVGSMGVTMAKLDIMLWSLFQKGATETAVTFEKNFIPYVQGQAAPEMWLDISRNIGDPASATGYGHLLAGAIVTQVGISGAQGERYTMSIELQGRTFRSDYVHTATVFTVESAADYAFLDFVWTLAGSSAKFQSVELTIANNAVPYYYNELVPTGFSLGMLNTTGTCSLAMSTATIGDNTQIDNWVSGADLAIIGAANTTDVVIKINAHYTGAEVDPAETELLLNLPYEGAYDGTNHSIEIDVESTIERTIPA